MRNVSYRRYLRLILVLGLLLAALGWAASLDSTPSDLSQPHNARDEVQAAWERVRAAGAYHFTADVTQRIIPAPTVTNVGRRSRQDALRLEGQTDLNEQEMQLTLWSNGGSVLDAADGVQVRVEGDRAFARRGDGAWEEIGDFTGTFAPAGDFLSFLVAARDISRAGEETRVGISFTRYTFGVDGPRFAAYVRDRLEKHLAEQGELPPGVTLDLPRAYVGMSGTGELWIGPDGLPLRQRLWLLFPEQDEARVEAEVTVDFSQFAPPAAQAGTLGWGPLVTVTPRDVGQVVLLLVLMLAFSLFLFVHRRSRTVYAALVLAVIASMLVTPLLQSHQLAAFNDRSAARAQAYEERQQEGETQEALREAAWEDAFDPHADPLAVANLEPQRTGTRSAPVNAIPPLDFAAQGATLTTATCNLSGSQLTPDDTSDTDADGLTDYQECILGTDAFHFDTDGDTITDTLEVRGFEFDGKDYYSDPLSLDSNGDGIGDIVEWWVAEVNDVPGDTDGDGAPDLFDDDNDGDGVRDKLDLSPFQTTAQVSSTGVVHTATRLFSRSNPLSLIINDLQPNRPTFVEFQMRPTNPDHLWYAFNVLDWPQGDSEGQMQDTDGATFAQVTGAGDATSENGDLKLVPMLEILITGEPDNLPVTATRTITDISGKQVTRTVYPELENYGIFVQTVEAGAKAAYVPLQITADPHSGARVAFSAKMLYRPDAEWGQAQQVRLVWVVQALVDHVCVERDDQDECVRYADNQVQVVHTYHDDWFLTGLSVREDYGSDMAIIYEDPALDDDMNTDNGLIGLVTVLDHTFLIGADCQETLAGGRSCLPGEGDGQRDYVIARHDPASTSRELGEMFDHTQNSAGDEIGPWGLPNRLRVSSASYDDRDEAMMTTVMTETVGILNAAFDLSQPVTPTLLFAREERARSLNLEEQDAGQAVTWQDRELTLDMDASPTPDAAGGRPVETLVGVTWAPYRRDAGGGWEAMPLQDYWEEMALRFSSAGDPDSDHARAQLLALNAYYLGLYNGLLNTVQIGDQARPAGVPDRSDADIEKDLADMYGAAAGQVLGPTGDYLLEYLYPEVPADELVGRAVTRAFDSGTAKPAFVLKGAKTMRLAKRLGTTSSVIGAFGFAAGLANLGVVIAHHAEPSEELEIVNQALNLTVETLSLVATSISIVQSIAVKALDVGYKAAVRSVLGATNLTKANVGGAAIGLVISLGVSWGFFFYAIFSQGLSGPALSIAIAGIVAATVVAVLFFVLSLTGIGSLVVALLTFIDALLSAIFGGFSFIGWFTEQLAKFFYSYSEAVTVEVEDTQLGPLDSDLRDPGLGFQAGNTLVVRSSMTTTIVHKDPPDSFYDAGTTGDVRHYWSLGNLRSTCFNYAFSAEPANSPTPWQTAYDHTYTRGWWFSWPMHRATAGDQAVVGQAPLTAGINFRPAVQLVTRYDLPGVECERIFILFGFYRDCDAKRTHGGQSTDMSTMVFDVFPADLTAFYDLENWGSWRQGVPDFEQPGNSHSRSGGMGFGPQRDYDGDGLLALEFGGNDPDDGDWDWDGDGLSDARELELRFQGISTFLGNPDSDGDQLDDGLEVRLGTDPGWWDSDGDGLSDKEEVDGWDFAYGQGLEVHVTSNPLAADEDGDGMSDAAERDLHLSDPERFPYHPRVFNAQPLALRTSMGGENVVYERGQAYVLPGATLVHTATVRNNLSAAIYAQGELTVSVPPELEGETQTYLLDYFGGEERAFPTQVSVPSDVGQSVVTSTVSAQLQPDQSQAGPILRQLNEDLTGTPGCEPAIAVATSEWDAPYVVVLEDEGFLVLYRVGTGGLISDTVVTPYSGFDSHVACANNGRCLVVWDPSEPGWDWWTAIHGALVTPDGMLPGSPFEIAGTAENRGLEHAVATDGNDFLVVWTEFEPLVGVTMFARSVSNLGVVGPQWTVKQLGAELERLTIDVACIGDQQYIVVWAEADDDPNPSEWLVRFMRAVVTTAMGPDSPTEILTATSPYLDGLSLQVAYDSTGHQGGTLLYSLYNESYLRSLPARPAPTCEVTMPPRYAPSVPLYYYPSYPPLVAFDPSSQSWTVTYPVVEYDESEYTADGSIQVYAYTPDCTLLAGPFIPLSYEHKAGTSLACGEHECAFVSRPADIWEPLRAYVHRVDLLEIPPAQGELEQSKEDRIQVDNDEPTVAFDAAAYSLPALPDASSFTLGGAASDPSSGIGRVEVSVNDNEWQPASGREAWAYTLSLLPGSGTYNLRARAVDLLGHESATAGATLTVISAPPGLDTDIQDDALLRASFDEGDGRWTLPISGTVTDMGGGLTTVDVQLTPNGSGWQTATPVTTTWHIDYPLAQVDAGGAVLTDPSGVYTFAARAADKVGNMPPEANYLTRQVRVDVTPPLAELTAIGGLAPRDAAVISQTVGLSGVASDAGPLPSGVGGVEVSFTDIQPITPTLDLQPASVDDVGAVDTTWSFPVPELEGFYQIDALGTDLAGNRNEARGTWGQWRGEVDTRGPQVILSAEHRGVGSTARTHYHLVATDLNLAEAGLDFPPCAGRGRVERTYYDSEWYLAHHGDPTRLHQLTHSCTRPGHQTEPLTVTACDVYDHCTSATLVPPGNTTAGALPLSVPERGPGGEVWAASADLDAYIFQPGDASALIAPGEITVSGGAYARFNLRSLTVSADGDTIYTQSWTDGEAVTDTTWSMTWTPASPGEHVLVAVVEDWAGNVLADLEPIAVIVALDDQPPAVAISDTFFNAEDLITSNRVDLSGTAASPVGVASVQVSVDGGPWRPTVLEATDFDTAAWLFPWALELPPNPNYTLTARVTDAAGRTAEVAETVAVDITPPDPVDITLSYVDTGGAGHSLPPGQTVRDAQSLVINWTASADDSGLGGYYVGWTASETPDPAALTAYVSADQAHTQAAGEAQALYAHIGIEDTAGNWTWQTLGPIYVDAPHTPDLVADLAYHGWLESGCALIGVDRDVSRTAPFAAALDAVQRLYATWSGQALRLTWTGADWEADGDLFIYLDTTGGGATTAFNPYAQPEPTIGLPPGMVADYVLWVEDGATASLRSWAGGAWAEIPEWTADLYLRLDTSLSPPHTDVLLPFDRLGNPTSLRLVAFASEEEALSLWATMPDENPRNSPRVISALAADLPVAGFDLTQDYAWTGLGPDQCPNAGQFTDSDLRLSLSADPASVAVGYLADDWLALAPGTRLDGDLDGVADVPLPIDETPAPLGTGDVIQYTLTYANYGTQQAADVRLRLTPYGGLQLTTGDPISLGDVPAGATGSIQFSAEVSAGGDRSAELDAVVSDATHGDFDWLWSLHPVDRNPPSGLAIHTPRDYVRSGRVTVGGVAQDASGLRQVTLTVAGTGQSIVCPDTTPRDGAWACDWEVPEGTDGQTFQLEVTATDLHDNPPSEPAQAVVTLDNTPPEVVSLDEVVTQALADGVLVPSEFVLSGQVGDNFQAAGARLCFEQDEGGHCVDVDARPGDASAGAWTYALSPLAADGISETLSIYGRDGVGNLSSVPVIREYELDNVGPQVEVTMQRGTIGLGSSLPAIAGTVQDANGVAKMFASLLPPEGEMLWPEVELTDEGDGWSMTMRAPNVPETIGWHTIRLYAQDGFGNLAGYGPFEVEVVEANAIPEVEAGPDQSADEGSLVSLAPATFHDDDAQDTHTATIDWGDGTQDDGVITKLQAESLPTTTGTPPLTTMTSIYLPVILKGISDTVPPAPPSSPGLDGTVSGSHVYADNGVYTVEVCVTDSMDNTGCDTLIITVDNVAPTVDAGPDQTVYRNDAVTVSGTWTDPADSLDNPYSWWWDLDGDGGADISGTAPYGDTISGTTLFALEGSYILTLSVTDKDGGSGSDSLAIDVLNRPPDCSAASPSIDIIWPADHKFVPVNVLGVTDPEQDEIAITIESIYQDEPVDTYGDGRFTPDGQGVGADTAEVRAERAGAKKVPGNGRVYHIGFRAGDGHGGACSGKVLVGVPHDVKDIPVDGGALYDSTALAP